MFNQVKPNSNISTSTPQIHKTLKSKHELHTTHITIKPNSETSTPQIPKSPIFSIDFTMLWTINKHPIQQTQKLNKSDKQKTNPVN